MTPSVSPANGVVKRTGTVVGRNQDRVGSLDELFRKIQWLGENSALAQVPSRVPKDGPRETFPRWLALVCKLDYMFPRWLAPVVYEMEHTFQGGWH